MTKAQSDFNQKSEMLDEYDFSGGVRGKYYEAYRNNKLQPLRGIQFLANTEGIKTGVLIDLSEHQSLLEGILNQFDSTVETQYVMNQHGNRVSILLNFKEHLPIWEKIYAHLIQEQQELEKSAQLYAEIYEEDEDLQKLTESALIDDRL